MFYDSFSQKIWNFPQENEEKVIFKFWFKDFFMFYILVYNSSTKN